jgi:hypothetical protein
MSESRPNRRFNGSALISVDPGATCGEMENRATLIARIVRAREQPLGHQPSEHSGKCAGMDVKQCGELAGRQTGEQPDDAQHEPLRPGDAKLGRHSLGGRVQAMDERPEQAHELQHVGQRLSGYS